MPTTLLSLPVEIRLQVYQYCLHGDYRDKIRHINDLTYRNKYGIWKYENPIGFVALMSTCKVVYAEAAGVLYSEFTFAFHNYIEDLEPRSLKIMYDFLDQIGPINRRYLRHVRLDLIAQYYWRTNRQGSSYVEEALTLLRKQHQLQTFELRIPSLYVPWPLHEFGRFFSGRVKGGTLEELYKFHDVGKFICDPPASFDISETLRWTSAHGGPTEGVQDAIEEMEHLKRNMESSTPCGRNCSARKPRALQALDDERMRVRDFAE